METVRLDQPLQVALSRDVAEGPALMDHPVMHDEIEKAVDRHAEPDPVERTEAG